MLLAELRRTNSARRISLSGLDPSSVEDFVATMVGHDLDRDLRLVAHSLAARTGGNAFYLGELWRQLISSGRVACEGGRWTVRSDADGDGVPESVREVESARLVTLSAPARHVVELMAIGGQRLPLRVVTAASDLAPDALDAGVEELVDARLLVEVGGSLPTYEFVHAIVRDSVAQTVRVRGTDSPAPSAGTGLRVGVRGRSAAGARRTGASLHRGGVRRGAGEGRATTPGVRPRRRCDRWPTTRRSPTSNRRWR